MEKKRKKIEVMNKDSEKSQMKIRQRENHQGWCMNPFKKPTALSFSSGEKNPNL